MLANDRFHDRHFHGPGIGRVLADILGLQVRQLRTILFANHTQIYLLIKVGEFARQLSFVTGKGILNPSRARHDGHLVSRPQIFRDKPLQRPDGLSKQFDRRDG